MDRELAPRRALIDALLDRAGELARAGFRAPAAVETKSDATLVSEVDRAIEKELRRAIAAEFPRDGLWGEEFGRERPEARWCWVLDPIDGTRAFLAGMPTFVTLIGLVCEGRPALGAVDQPVVGDRWLGVEGHGCWHGGRSVRTRACAELGQALLAATDPWLFPPEDRPVLAQLSGRCRARVTGGDGLLYGLLASGHLDLVLESGLAWHDIAAAVPVVRGAGGWIGGWQGEELTWDRPGRVLAAGSAALAELALEELAGAVDP